MSDAAESDMARPSTSVFLQGSLVCPLNNFDPASEHPSGLKLYWTSVVFNRYKGAQGLAVGGCDEKYGNFFNACDDASIRAKFTLVIDNDQAKVKATFLVSIAEREASKKKLVNSMQKKLYELFARHFELLRPLSESVVLWNLTAFEKITRLFHFHQKGYKKRELADASTCGPNCPIIQATKQSCTSIGKNWEVTELRACLVDEHIIRLAKDMTHTIDDPRTSGAIAKRRACHVVGQVIVVCMQCGERKTLNKKENKKVTAIEAVVETDREKMKDRMVSVTIEDEGKEVTQFQVPIGEANRMYRNSLEQFVFYWQAWFPQFFDDDGNWLPGVYGHLGSKFAAAGDDCDDAVLFKSICDLDQYVAKVWEVEAPRGTKRPGKGGGSSQPQHLKTNVT